MAENFFNFKDKTNGGVSISKVPSDLNKYIAPMRELYLKESDSTEIDNTLNHIWYTDSSLELKTLIEKFQTHPFFKNLCKS